MINKKKASDEGLYTLHSVHVNEGYTVLKSPKPKAMKEGRHKSLDREKLAGDDLRLRAKNPDNRLPAMDMDAAGMLD